jgi:signal transduction histidine kinase
VKRGTIRLRLTALYAGLFLATSTILLIGVNLLLRVAIENRVTIIRQGSVPMNDTGQVIGVPKGDPIHFTRSAEMARAVSELPDAMARFQWTVTAVFIIVLTLVSVVAGWWLAGRMLRPLHHITATARRLSLTSLHERIALSGPADELKELADTFDAMLERLGRSVDSQSRFVANASHELRTPLAIQRASIEIGLADPLPGWLAEVRQELLETNRRSERLIDGLLVLAQGERGLDGREPVRLDELVRKAAEDLALDDMTLMLDVEPVTVSGDTVLLSRLVANLLDNAVRYNRPGGSVEVGLTAEGALVVRNTGAEVPPERIGELFEPFRRLHAARTRSAEGAGLGLSIVASIARAHDAEVTARPNSGGGLEFTVRFPALAPPSPKDRSPGT